MASSRTEAGKEMHIKIVIAVISKTHSKTRGQIKERDSSLIRTQAQCADNSVAIRKSGFK